MIGYGMAAFADSPKVKNRLNNFRSNKMGFRQASWPIIVISDAFCKGSYFFGEYF